MYYNISVKLKSKSKNMRSYLRKNGFKIYSRDHFGILLANHEDDEEDPAKWAEYECVRGSNLKPSQELMQKLDDEITHGMVTSYQINAIE